MNNITDYIRLDEREVSVLNPLVWAFVGDAIFEVYVRSYIVSKGKKNSMDLHKESIKYVKAEAQARVLESIIPILSEEEQNIARRGRNTKTHHVPKNARVIDYRMATAFEALIGYLFLMKRHDRLGEIMDYIFRAS